MRSMSATRWAAVLAAISSAALIEQHRLVSLRIEPLAMAG